MDEHSFFAFRLESLALKIIILLLGRSVLCTSRTILFRDVIRNWQDLDSLSCASASLKALNICRKCSFTNGPSGSSWRMMSTVVSWKLLPTQTIRSFLIFKVFSESLLNLLNYPVSLKSALTESAQCSGRCSVLSVFTNSRILVTLPWSSSTAYCVELLEHGDQFWRGLPPKHSSTQLSEEVVALESFGTKSCLLTTYSMQSAGIESQDNGVRPCLARIVLLCLVLFSKLTQ